MKDIQSTTQEQALNLPKRGLTTEWKLKKCLETNKDGIQINR